MNDVHGSLLPPGSREEIPKGVTPSARIQRGLPKQPRGDQ
jgi:hypothetical protein